MTHTISVIIPTYNREDYIAKAIQSALDQSQSISEIIVVDDGSSDNTKKIVESFSSPLVTYVQQENSGVVAARKHAIEKSSGQWIALLDSDDVWEKDYLTQAIDCSKTYPEVEFIVTNFQDFSNDGALCFDQFATAPADFWENVTESRVGHFALMKEDCYLDFLRYTPWFASGHFFSRELYDRIGGMDLRVGRRIPEDGHHARRMAATGRMACNFSRLVKIRKHNTNATKNLLQLLMDKIELLHMLADNDQISEKYKQQTIAIANSRYPEAFNKAFELGSWTNTVELYRKMPRSEKGHWKNVLKYTVARFRASSTVIS